jgi:hypothetical protein
MAEASWRSHDLRQPSAVGSPHFRNKEVRPMDAKTAALALYVLALGMVALVGLTISVMIVVSRIQA